MEKTVSGAAYMGARKNDIILIAVLMAAALIAFYILRAGREDGSGLYVQITRDGETVMDQSLDDTWLPFTYEVRSEDGGVNIFVIDRTEGGGIGMSCTEADCPDKICVETGTVTLSDEPIVCLPHKVVARLYSR